MKKGLFFVIMLGFVFICLSANDDSGYEVKYKIHEVFIYKYCFPIHIPSSIQFGFVGVIVCVYVRV